jgi:2'-5' RNA ligase
MLRRKHYPSKRNQVPAHLTLFHHLPPSLLSELDGRLKAEVRIAPRPFASMGEPMLLDTGVILRVRSDALAALRERLAEAFTGMLVPQDAANWRPHVTIQNKANPAEAKRLHAQMTADFHRSRPLSLTGFATHFYRDGPWELIARYRFSG